MNEKQYVFGKSEKVSLGQHTERNEEILLKYPIQKNEEQKLKTVTKRERKNTLIDNPYKASSSTDNGMGLFTNPRINEVDCEESEADNFQELSKLLDHDETSHSLVKQENYYSDFVDSFVWEPKIQLMTVADNFESLGNINTDSENRAKENNSEQLPSNMECTTLGKFKDRIFACPWENCYKTYVQKILLETHLLAHKNEKPFKCPGCEKYFRTKGTAKQHYIRKHDPQRTYLQNENEYNQEILILNNKVEEPINISDNSTNMSKKTETFFPSYRVEEQDTKKTIKGEEICTLNDNSSIASSCTDNGTQLSTKRRRHNVNYCELSSDNNFQQLSQSLIKQEKHHADPIDSFVWEPKIQLLTDCLENNKTNFENKAKENNSGLSVDLEYTELEMRNKYLFACPWKNCEKKFKQIGGLKYHLQVHEREKPFKCGSCNQFFASDRSLKHHALLAHNPQETAHTTTGKVKERVYVCPWTNCQKKYVQKCLFETHLLVHKKEKPFGCPSCEKTFRTKGTAKQHFMRKHDPKRTDFECHQCSASFKTNIGLSNHLQTHTQHIVILKRNRSVSQQIEKTFKCPECNKEFAHYSSIGIHLRLHRGEKPFECSECHKKFLHRNGLAYHSRIHKQNSPLVLQGNKSQHIDQTDNDVSTKVKGSTSRVSTRNKSTMKTNSDVIKRRARVKKQYICIHCNEQHKSQPELEIHMKIHTNTKPLKCSECYKVFSNIVLLEKHTQTHKKIRLKENSETNFKSTTWNQQHNSTHKKRNKTNNTNTETIVLEKRILERTIKIEKDELSTEETPCNAVPDIEYSDKVICKEELILFD